eukprot:COSAG05_NODE_1710_length_4237_cov_3.480667_5_plen_158_part_00
MFPYLSRDGHDGTDGDKIPNTLYTWNRQTDFRHFKCETVNQTRLASAGGSGCLLPYCCCEELLSIKPVIGDAILFFPLKADGSKEEMAVHASCPVLTTATADELVASGGDDGSNKEVVQQWFHATHPDEDSALYPPPSAYASKHRRSKKARRRKNQN